MKHLKHLKIGITQVTLKFLNSERFCPRELHYCGSWDTSDVPLRPSIHESTGFHIVYLHCLSYLPEHCIIAELFLIMTLYIKS